MVLDLQAVHQISCGKAIHQHREDKNNGTNTKVHQELIQMEQELQAVHLTFNLTQKMTLEVRNNGKHGLVTTKTTVMDKIQLLTQEFPTFLHYSLKILLTNLITTRTL